MYICLMIISHKSIFFKPAVYWQQDLILYVCTVDTN